MSDTIDTLKKQLEEAELRIKQTTKELDILANHLPYGPIRVRIMKITDKTLLSPASAGAAPKDVGEIVKAYLEERGCDGLYNGYAECGCEISDLIPGGTECMIIDCQPARKGPCKGEDCSCDGDCDWHMVPVTKEKDSTTPSTEEHAE